MKTAQCPSLAAMLTHGQAITHRRHTRGWIETPDGRFFQPKVSNVQFVSGRTTPFLAPARRRSRWLLRLMEFIS